MPEGWLPDRAENHDQETPSDPRREWDSNPRCLEDTTVFETVRFGRSRIPPPARLATPPVGEERGQQRRALPGQHPGQDLDLVIEPRVGAQVVERPARPGLRVGSAEDQTGQ